MSKQQVLENSQKESFINQVIEDYRICCISREASLLGRKEVLRGKAKFGIFGDGKEVPQVAMARAFKRGDFRSGYYRDQTFMMALGLCSVEDFFAQLYADPENDPYSGGRQMNAHFATQMVDEEGNWVDHRDKFNITSDISPTAGQMARGLGIALASKLYRTSEALQNTQFSVNGNEVCFCTIGDASTSEGVFWETMNAAGVMQVPLSVSVWDDGYGISVPKKYQTTKASISEALMGFEADENSPGFDIYKVMAWDYPMLVQVYDKAISKTRETFAPSLIHVLECTQPQGHSTSGSHERYKTPERLEWEKEHDCIKKMGEWMIEAGIASESELKAIQDEARKLVKEKQSKAWAAFTAPVKDNLKKVVAIGKQMVASYPNSNQMLEVVAKLEKSLDPQKYVIIKSAKALLRLAGSDLNDDATSLLKWLREQIHQSEDDYLSKLYSEDENSALSVPVVAAEFNMDSKTVNGYEILNHCFDQALETKPEVFAFGEDVGHIGDVNQGFAGLQEKFGKHRVFDTGIREWTIMGQAIGMAMRGLRPIAEIQYLDYLIYGLTPLSDDLATLRYRSAGLQQAPAIIRTRGHRLEGIWHTGSPLGMVLNSLRGMYVCTPRNMTQAAGMYTTLLRSNDPAIVIECLNGYRLKEKLPENIGEFTIPLGQAEILNKGSDVTLVTYGSCIRIAQDAILKLEEMGISVELIDPQTLIPFDRNHIIAGSLEKTNRLVVLDEDVPGGGSAFILQQILEEQDGYFLLDAKPRTISSYDNRNPFGSDGDYITKPNTDDIVETIYALMHEADPKRFPKLYFLD
ncbi:MAG: thiamine pyrophosphate-dependent enzyme [Bacteroidota bacterium]